MSETETEPKGLDDILSSAIEEHYVDPSVSSSDTPPEAVETESAKAERLRDERGRFASAPEQAHSEGTAPALPPVEGQPDPAKPVEAPGHFNAEQKAEFAKLAPEAQQYVTRIEKAREAEYTRRSQETAEFRRTADPLLQAVAPYQQYLAQRSLEVGATPPEMIGRLVATEHSLRTGNPQQRAQAFVQLAQQYQVDLAALNGGNPIPQPQFTQPQISPDQIREEARRAAEAVFQKQQEEQRTQSTIQSFLTAKDDSGQAKYPFAESEPVKQAMAMYLAQQNDDGRTPEQLLSDAYGYATAPFKEMLTAQAATKQQAQAEAVAKAKKAVPVKASSSRPGAVQPKGLESHLSAAIERYMT
jgi:hypothetical protein